MSGSRKSARHLAGRDAGAQATGLSGSADSPPTVASGLSGTVAVALSGSLLLSTLAGCYPNPDDLRQGSSGASGDCASFASTWCAKLYACEPVIGPYSFGDAAVCRQRMGSYCTTILTAESDTGWNATALASCASGWSAISCADWMNDPAQFPGAACRIAGHRVAGTSCGRDIQCASRHCGYASGSDFCGICGPFATQGQECFNGANCATGLGCSDDGTCTPWGNVGDACGSARPCLNTLECRNGTCAVLAAPGAACSDEIGCDLNQGVLCNFTTGKCGTAVAATTCDSEQVDGKVRYCSSKGLCNSGACIASAGDGQACSDTGARCIYPSFCSSSSSLCTPPSLSTCGGTPPHPDAGTTDPAGAAAASALCNRLQTCAPRRLTAIFGTAEVCQQRIKVGFDSLLMLPDIGWTQASLSACANAQLSQSCADFNDGKVPDGCAVAGRRATGQACRTSDQCAGMRCIGAAGACGQCAARVASGGACASDSDCLPPLVCAMGTSATGLCVAAVGMNAACNPASSPCRRSLACRAGTCSTPGGAGVACADIEDCDERGGFLCNAATSRCAGATGGTTCNLSAPDGNLQYCSAGGNCTTAPGACVAAAADGQACSPTGALCVYPATCTGSICVPPSGSDCP